MQFREVSHNDRTEGKDAFNVWETASAAALKGNPCGPLRLNTINVTMPYVPMMYDRTNSEHHEETGRTISLAPDLPAIPERLLLAHARGDVVFLCGAGVSRPAGLPDFEQLVRGVYRTLDPSIYEILSAAPIDPRYPPKPDCSLLTDRQTAEVRRFLAREFDVVLGMLERRLDSRTREDSQVRARVIELLRTSGGKLGSATPKSEDIAVSRAE